MVVRINRTLRKIEFCILLIKVFIAIIFNFVQFDNRW